VYTLKTYCGHVNCHQDDAWLFHAKPYDQLILSNSWATCLIFCGVLLKCAAYGSDELAIY